MTAVPVLSRMIKYKIMVLAGENQKPGFAIDKFIDLPKVTVGRGPENDLAFTNDIRMSRSHAEIFIANGRLFVKNISSKNFILVDSEKVDFKEITNESRVQIGDAVFRISVSLGMNQTNSTPPLELLKSAPRSSQQSGPAPKPFRPMSVSKNEGSRFRFYGIIALVVGGAYWFLTSGSGTRKVDVGLRTDGDIARSIEQSAGAVDLLKKQKETNGEESLQYKTAQEHYIKGFRDYRNGQYARAIESFQAALSFFPPHELARKYLIESQKKFDELVKFNMNQGRKYYGKNNFRLCRSSFASAMIMVKRTDDKNYREAKQYYNECNLRLEGRY